MRRKLMVMLLIGTLSLLGIVPALAQEVYNLKDYEQLVGKKLTYSEAPELKVKVAAGELPPVEERLPEEPLVVKPIEAIGQYGGTWHRSNLGVLSFQVYCEVEEHLFSYDEYCTKILPNIVKGWKISEDAKTVTFFLRKGMKWSDGVPFTADDFVFCWNDILLNKDLNPVVTGKLTIGGEPGTIKKIDDYTFSLSFAAPYGMVVEMFANAYPPAIFAPAHYLKQFHPKYTPMESIEKMMKKESFASWQDYFKAKNDINGGNPERPVVGGWYPIDEKGSAVQRLVRNPYYFKIDTEGNQLPYIDKIWESLMADSEAILLRALAGELDYQALRICSVANYPVCKQNEEKGDYRVIPQVPMGAGSNLCSLHFNFFHKDPILRDLFRNKKFRVALSVAINREEISNLLFKGLANPSQVAPSEKTPWYVEEYAKQYTEYDPKTANKILDELGLAWDKNHEYRLRSDGKQLRFVISAFTPWPPENVETSELIKGYWKDIGINAVVKPVDRQLWVTQVTAAEFEVASYAATGGSYGEPPVGSGWIFPTSAYSYWAPMWGLWLGTNGKSGEEPPADVKRLYEIYKEIPKLSSEEERIELTKEAFKIHAKNLWMLGIMTRPGIGDFFIVKNNMGNGIQKDGYASYRTASIKFPNNWCTLFFKK